MCIGNGRWSYLLYTTQVWNTDMVTKGQMYINTVDVREIVSS